MSELPYQVEYAKTGRASCKKCKEKIHQGGLRLAVMVQSAFFDGKQPNWYHEKCFFLMQRPKNVYEIGKFNILEPEDQKRIKETIDNLTHDMDVPMEKKGKVKGSKRGNIEINNPALKDFAVEYSKSSRATCKVCDIKICKGEVRICKIAYDTEVGKKFGGQQLWHHVHCFAEARSELLYLAGGEDLPGFKSLKDDAQKLVTETIKPLKLDAIPTKKLKVEIKNEEEIQKEKEVEKEIGEQNSLFQMFRKTLNGLDKCDLENILRANSQKLSYGYDEKINHLADCMAFGALEPCPKCNKGQYVLENYGYKCTGNISEWTKCQNVTQNPKRTPLVIPKSLEHSPIFLNYKPEVGTRLFTSKQLQTQTVIKKEEPGECFHSAKPIPPLKNLQFFIHGKVTSKDEVKKRILKLGGLVISKLNDSLAAVVSTKADVEKVTGKMKSIKEQQIEVVDESFLDLIDNEKGSVGDSLQLIKENNIANWGSDPKSRVPQHIVDGTSLTKSAGIHTKLSKSGVQKLKVKGGATVDPDSGLEDVAHVYIDHSGVKWTVVLNKMDIVEQKNSYYKLQLLENDITRSYWVFTSWGRTGTKIGGKKVKSCRDLHEAKSLFQRTYKDKTHNYWDDRHNFVKVPDGYYPIDMDYGDIQDGDQGESKSLTVDTNSKLPLPVQRLICRIFDVQLMKRTLMEFELDAEKMPLGKLSKKQIMAGYKVLSELLELMEKGEATETEVINSTNKFYTLIPHDFGVANPPLLGDLESIKKKAEMLDNLLEIEIAYNMLKEDADADDGSLSPVDAHYLKLKAEIVPLDRKSPEYEMILTYVKNTHAATHGYYTLEVEEIFKVARENEEERYMPFKKLHNRRLLWHGSRTTNFTGIISQGLRIAPPEAPSTGYMFGKGIYFADMVSKSANYCCSNQYDSVGLMLLCEVALGDMKECSQAEFVTELPSGKHSVWGLGRTQPTPSENRILEDGTIVPLGKPQTRDVNAYLLYNEFIVYDVAQVNVKYLLQMKFNFNTTR